MQLSLKTAFRAFMPIFCADFAKQPRKWLLYTINTIG